MYRQTVLLAADHFYRLWENSCPLLAADERRKLNSWQSLSAPILSIVEAILSSRSFLDVRLTPIPSLSVLAALPS